jgi:two-component system, LuxR family, sensor histidine kinase DctS
MTTPLRVLLIDDSEADTALLLLALRRGGTAPIWRRVDSAAALEDALAERWELVLCDWHMPGFGGSEALALLRRHDVDAPIIIVSSDFDDTDAGAALRGGAHDYISKRSLPRLLPAIERELREAEGRRARRNAEAALRASEERFAKAFDYAPIGMALVAIDGTLLKVNRAFCAMLGYSEAELTHTPVWHFTHLDDMPATIEQLQRLLENEIDTWFLEKRYRHCDGHLLWGRSTTWLVRDAQGTPQYVVSQVQDITDSKRLEEQTRQQQAALAHALRVATMGETLAQIAHEVNQPLASIANFANGLVARLDRNGVERATARAVAVQIADEAVRAGEVIRRLRDFLRKSEPKRATYDANTIVRDALRLVRAEVRQHAIRLELGLTRDPMPVAIDPVQITQVVVNLLRNAVDALLPQPPGERELAVGTERCGTGAIAILVRDSGVGLPNVPDGAIFEPFFTTKPEGLGLGLSISRSIVQAHEGDLWARRNATRGTTVGFTLPAVLR